MKKFKWIEYIIVFLFSFAIAILTAHFAPRIELIKDWGGMVGGAIGGGATIIAVILTINHYKKQLEHIKKREHDQDEFSIKPLLYARVNISHLKVLRFYIKNVGFGPAIIKNIEYDNLIYNSENHILSAYLENEDLNKDELYYILEKNYETEIELILKEINTQYSSLLSGQTYQVKVLFTSLAELVDYQLTCEYKCDNGNDFVIIKNQCKPIDK